MGRRLISLVAALAIGTVGALAFAAPSTAATSPASTPAQCEFPDEELKALPTVAKADSEEKVYDILDRVLQCLDYDVVDKCDGTTVITAVNWAVSDNKWTRLTFEILGKDYLVKGGPDHTPVVVTLGPPGVEDVQVYLVFEGEKNGTSWRIEVPLLKDLYDWKLPAACPTATPSATATPSPSPSVSTSTSAPATTTAPPPAAAPQDDNGLPTTGASLAPTLITGSVAVVLGTAVLGFMLWRRRKAEAQ